MKGNEMTKYNGEYQEEGDYGNPDWVWYECPQHVKEKLAHLFSCAHSVLTPGIIESTMFKTTRGTKHYEIIYDGRFAKDMRSDPVKKIQKMLTGSTLLKLKSYKSMLDMECPSLNRIRFWFSLYGT